MQRAYIQTQPMPLSLLSTIATKLAQKGWRHEDTIVVGKGELKGALVGANGKVQTEIAIVILASGLVEDPENFQPPELD